MASTALRAGSAVAPMRQRQTLEFPYKHSTGETVGRFLAGLKEQKKIWGQRVSGQGVVVPPLGYSEIDGSDAGEWVEVKDTGVVTAVARVEHPVERLHPSATPFAFVLVKLDGADTALAHIVREDLDRVAVGARVQAVWAPDDARIGRIRDIDSFRVIADAPQPKPALQTKTVKAPQKTVSQEPASKAKPVAKASAASKKRQAKPAKVKPAATARKAAKSTKTARRVTRKTTPKAKAPAKARKRTRTTKAKPRVKAHASKRAAAKAHKTARKKK